MCKPTSDHSLSQSISRGAWLYIAHTWTDWTVGPRNPFNLSSGSVAPTAVSAPSNTVTANMTLDICHKKEIPKTEYDVYVFALASLCHTHARDTCRSSVPFPPNSWRRQVKKHVSFCPCDGTHRVAVGKMNHRVLRMYSFSQNRWKASYVRKAVSHFELGCIVEPSCIISEKNESSDGVRLLEIYRPGWAQRCTPS